MISPARLRLNRRPYRVLGGAHTRTINVCVERDQPAAATNLGQRSPQLMANALRVLAADRRRQDALRSFLADWDVEDGPVDDHNIDAMAERYDL